MFVDHPYYVAVQYHPEYLTRPLKPSAPYLGLILASCNRLSTYLARGARISPDCKVNSAATSDDDCDERLSTLNIIDPSYSSASSLGGSSISGEDYFNPAPTVNVLINDNQIRINHLADNGVPLLHTRAVDIPVGVSM